MTAQNCLCNEDDLTACDWEVNVVLTVSRTAETSGYNSVTTHKQCGLNILQASAIASEIVSKTNQGLLEELGDEIRACSESKDTRFRASDNEAQTLDAVIRRAAGK